MEGKAWTHQVFGRVGNPGPSTYLHKWKNPEMFTKYIEPLYVFYLKDRASAIRVEAISHLQLFSKIYGITWVNSYVSKLFDSLAK